MKKMMLIGYTDKVGIKAVAPMRVPSYHVAERTPHPLKWTPKSPPSATVVDDFIIDDLDPNKSMGGQLSLVYSTITTLATSAVTQERQYVKAIADLKAGQPVESKPVGEDAHRRYTAALARVGDGRTVAGRSRAAEAARDGHGDALVAFQAGDAVGPSAATQAAGADYQGAVAAYRVGNPVGPSPGAQAARADYDTAMLALEGGHAVGPSAAAQAGDTDFQAGHHPGKKRRS